MFDDSSVLRAGVLDGVQYSTLPGSDVTGSLANESDDATASNTKGSRTQPPVHTEVTQQAYQFNKMADWGSVSVFFAVSLALACA
jgi:hypothetical protein